MTVESRWFVWITVLTDNYVEQLVGRLVAHGWTVSSADSNSRLTTSTDNVTIVNLCLLKIKENPLSKIDVLNELKETMTLLGMTWLSVVVAAPTEATWSVRKIEYSPQINDEKEVVH